MKIILLRGKGLQPLKISISKWHFIFSLLILVALAFQFQYLTKTHTCEISEVHDLKKSFHRLSKIEAQIQRLNLLGAYIAKKKNINIESFHLSQDPAIGGTVGEYIEPVLHELTEKQLLESIRKSESFLKVQKVKLQKKMSFESPPQYLSPVSQGYISSGFGMRTDPINGEHRYHKGIDIAGRNREPVKTIASGFVTFTGEKGAYGKVVEIHHSDSLKSRYAHLDSFSVKNGEVVRKGQKIATMGKTGRVTGPHLHLEIWKDGKAINPKKYINIVLDK